MTVTNPNQVWDLTGVRQADDGAETFRASTAIDVGDVVVFDPVTTETIPTVSTAQTTSPESLVAGVALTSAAVGQIVYVRLNGLARVKIQGAVSAGQRATRSGSAAGRAAAAGANPPDGTTFGVFLSGNLGNQTAIVRVDR